MCQMREPWLKVVQAWSKSSLIFRLYCRSFWAFNEGTGFSLAKVFLHEQYVRKQQYHGWVGYSWRSLSGKSLVSTMKNFAIPDPHHRIKNIQWGTATEMKTSFTVKHKWEENSALYITQYRINCGNELPKQQRRKFKMAELQPSKFKIQKAELQMKINSKTLCFFYSSLANGRTGCPKFHGISQGGRWRATTQEGEATKPRSEQLLSYVPHFWHQLLPKRGMLRSGWSELG